MSVRVVWYGMVVLCVDAWDTERIRDGYLTQAIRYHTGLPLYQNQSTYLNNLLHINEARYCRIYPILYHLRLAWCDTCAISYTDVIVLCAQYSNQRHLPHGLLTRNAKWRVANAPGMPGIFSQPPTSEQTAIQWSRHASRHVRPYRPQNPVILAPILAGYSKMFR